MEPGPGAPPRFMPALVWNWSKIALRKVRRQKAYSFINVAGLDVGRANLELGVRLGIIVIISTGIAAGRKSPIPRPISWPT
jgi:hypothetical protein